MNEKEFYINNIDLNLICEQPKISKYRDKIKRLRDKILGHK